MTLVMSAERAAQLGLEPKAYFRGWTVAGCEPDEMGIGPVFAIPKLLKANNLTINDIDLVELNEAFASQCVYSRDRLEIDPEIYNVNGGSISIGHPFGMTGSRLTGHLVRELSVVTRSTALSACASVAVWAQRDSLKPAKFEPSIRA